MSLSQMALMPQKRYMGLTQIDLIIQIYIFFCGFRDFCEKLSILSQIALMPQNGGASLGIYHSAQNRTKTVKKKATPSHWRSLNYVTS